MWRPRRGGLLRTSRIYHISYGDRGAANISRAGSDCRPRGAQRRKKTPATGSAAGASATSERLHIQKGYYLSVNETLPLRFRSNFPFASVRNWGANDVCFAKPKSLRNRIAHRSFAAQNHIQVSAINVVVFGKSALTSLAFNCGSQQINDVATGEGNCMDLVIGLGRHGFIPRRRTDRRGMAPPFLPSLPSSVDAEQIADATFDGVDGLRRIADRKGGIVAAHAQGAAECE